MDITLNISSDLAVCISICCAIIAVVKIIIKG